MPCQQPPDCSSSSNSSSNNNSNNNQRISSSNKRQLPGRRRTLESPPFLRFRAQHLFFSSNKVKKSDFSKKKKLF
jgi:hypothetical protein